MRQRLTEHEQRILAEIERSLSRDGRLDRAMRTMTPPRGPLPVARRASPRWMRVAWWVLGFWACLLIVGVGRHVVEPAVGAVLGAAPTAVLCCLWIRGVVRHRRGSL